jgi:hypothetical protein
VFIRPVSPAGEADIAVEGPGNSLMYYWTTPGSPVYHLVEAGDGTTYSAPSIYVQTSGEAYLAVQGPGGALRYYTAPPGSQTFSATTIAAG